jgi:hypothetical protein
LFLEWTDSTADEVYARNERLTGSCGFLPNDEKQIGKYPEILRDHPYRDIDDVRNQDQMTGNIRDYVPREAVVEHNVQSLIWELVRKNPF